MPLSDSPTLERSQAGFAEEERSRQHSIFSVVRALTTLMGVDDDPQLGLYGAFGYDLTFQFETIALTQRRDATQRDLVLYLPDEIMVIQPSPSPNPNPNPNPSPSPSPSPNPNPTLTLTLTLALALTLSLTLF